MPAGAGRQGEQPRGRREPAEHRCDLRRDPDRILARVEQVGELPQGPLRVAAGGRVDHAPGGALLRGPGELVHDVGLNGLAAVGGRATRGEPGDRLVDLAEVAGEPFEEPGGGRCGELDAMPGLRPMTHPCRQVVAGRDGGVDRQAMGGHRLGEPRVAGKRTHLQDHEAAATA